MKFPIPKLRPSMGIVSLPIDWNKYVLLVAFGLILSGLIFPSLSSSNTSSVSVSVISLNAGGDHTCALVSDGTLRCWGNNQEGELGNKNNSHWYGSPTPLQVNDISSAIAVTTGFNFTCALLQNHTVPCWGENNSGQLGHVTKGHSSYPLADSGLTTVAVAAGGYHICAALKDGGARCWGRNIEGQLGDGTTSLSSSPVPVKRINSAVGIVAGHLHTCALLRDTTVQCWGEYVGNTPSLGMPRHSSIPLPVTGLTDVEQLSAGGGHTCANQSFNEVSHT